MPIDQNPKSKIEANPSFPKSYKKAFPFKIGTTSYLFPDHIIPNVRAIGPYVDEIELILFESKPESLPSVEEIRILKTLSEDLDITFNIHLPLDVRLGSCDLTQRSHAVERVKAVHDLTAQLNPTTHTLHLTYDGPADNEACVDRWKSHLRESFEELHKGGINGESISIETLSYPLRWIDDIIDTYHLCVCVDLGHLLMHNISLLDMYHHYCDRISIYHLHGVREGRDHQSMVNLPETTWNALLGILKRFEGVVSLEVFSFDQFNTSLTAFESRWNRFLRI